MKSISLQDLNNLQDNISEIFSTPELLKRKESQECITQCLRYLEDGTLRVSSPEGEGPNCGEVEMKDLQNWEVHVWVKQAILLAMRMRTAETFKWELNGNVTSSFQDRIHAGVLGYHDKLDVRKDLASFGVRSVYGSVVREGAFISKGVILMPSFVNIGAWVGLGTMIDTWATAGSCAQIGKNVHVAGGVGIGGVLEPENARPVIIGDNAFLGSRVIVVEGTIVGEGAILAANVSLTSSTPIYDVTTQDKKEYRGIVPPNAVVVAGTRMKEFAGGEVPIQCAYIIAFRSPKTDTKVSLNHILRETGIPV
ncbi:2,3,4,5-tetrahydropyridine-2,6-dicarboxylate N-succinyltransferase [Silvanigrella paludirubra]|uniref:2,3,4,5-tetrahydropyridine-2,6-dicarboxylate N-succinyltransferase n=1 Tax=Silvanigrella paludirubra TaxID=2499159 RepID=A0A6N6VZJ1_9BACT|nr:2,3,4,5-tetrahydropyridine-2,6-dicarboxylate N-succinyltransferase [Silvanigrella paludirubra]KAB8040706.1 2,3,4,5-tetrahydropyridine-2,6-dicarboxylate N-succinyltransferase [Silvanigrella paludirubra]